MPQLAKGGKHVFGWSRVRATGCIMVPPEALAEYHMAEAEILLLLPGSRTSGGFVLGRYDRVRQSPRGTVLDRCRELRDLQVAEGEWKECAGKPYCWIQLRNSAITLPLSTLAQYGIKAGDKLMVIRGSGLAIGFSVRGPLVAEAPKHALLEF